MKCLQTLQNCLAYSPSNHQNPKTHDITPVLKTLHWFKVPLHIHLQLCLLHTMPFKLLNLIFAVYSLSNYPVVLILADTLSQPPVFLYQILNLYTVLQLEALWNGLRILHYHMQL